MKKYILLIFLFVNAFQFVFAQEFERKEHIIKGNRAYAKKEFQQAEIEYKTALVQDGNSIKANYNLGNALYHQDKKDEARVHYDRVLQNRNASSDDRFKAYHNIGKTYLDEQKYEQAAQNFKEALKLNPNDDETRYNYALARKKLEQQQSQDGGQKNQNQPQSDSNQDQNEDQNPNDSSSQKQQSDAQQGNEQNQENQTNSQPSDSDENAQKQNQEGRQQNQGQNGNADGNGDGKQEITKGSDGKGRATGHSSNNDRQERILEALGQQEQETFKRIISQKAEKQRSKTEKDW